MRGWKSTSDKFLLKVMTGVRKCRCYLNGIHIKGLLTVQTLFAKVGSVAERA